jgi:Eukaryotic DNA topoisomerase I, DNA binding fragment
MVDQRRLAASVLSLLVYSEDEGSTLRRVVSRYVSRVLSACHPIENAPPSQRRVRPEDIVINIGEGEKVPVPGVPGKWKEVVHNNTVTWLAHWKENINGQCKYVFLAATSAIKGKSDRDKFERARELKVWSLCDWKALH